MLLVRLNNKIVRNGRVQNRRKKIFTVKSSRFETSQSYES